MLQHTTPRFRICLLGSLLTIACMSSPTPEVERAGVEAEVLEKCAAAAMDLPLERYPAVAHNLTGFGFKKSEETRNDDLALYTNPKLGGVTFENCETLGRGPVVVRSEEWVYAKAEVGPEIHVDVVEPDEWVTRVSIDVHTDRMPGLWGAGTPSENVFGPPYAYVFLLSSAGPCATPEGTRIGPAEQAIMESDAAWLRFVRGLATGAQLDALPTESKGVVRDFGALHLFAMVLFPTDARPGGWTVNLSCKGTWAQARAVMAQGGWSGGTDGEEPVVGTVASVPAVAEPSLVDLGYQEELDKRAAEIKAYNERWPSPERDHIRREFDEAPRDPLDGDASLAAMYQILRDLDGCDPEGAGYTLSAGSLRIMRNTPFAQHGYTFASEDLAKIFGQESWYTPNPAVTAESPPVLAPADEACVAHIKELEGGR